MQLFANDREVVEARQQSERAYSRSATRLQRDESQPAGISSLHRFNSSTSPRAMENIPDATLLIQDLLSPAFTLLPSTTPALLSYHLAKLPLEQPHLDLLTSLVTYLTTSPALWRGQASPSSSAPRWSPLNFARAQEVFNALVQGWLYRAGELSAELGTGWRARRKYAAFLEAYMAGVNAEEEGQCHPVVRVLATSAALTALQSIKMRKDKLYVGGSSLMGRAEEEVLKAWVEYFREDERDQRGSAANGAATEWSGGASGEFHMRPHCSSLVSIPPSETRSRRVSTDYASELPAWLASQTLPQFPVDSLANGPVAVRPTVSYLLG